MKIATWNVNSIRARQDSVMEWLRDARPDVLCMQETKVVDDEFPTSEFLRLGYEIVLAGQKSYNGVAIASLLPLSDVTTTLSDESTSTEQRYISARVAGVHVVSVYVPNGKSVESPFFQEKLRWLSRLRATLSARYSPSDDLVVCGDFNVAPDDRDVHDPDRWRGQVLFHPDEHRALAGVMDFGLVDTLRFRNPAPSIYSWWDYRAGAFRLNRGLRIDLILATPGLADRCTSCVVDKTPRSHPKPSDHAPVVAEFDPKAE